MQVSDFMWALCEENPTMFLCENPHYPGGRLMTSTSGPGGFMETECDTSHNWHFICRFSGITIYFVTNEALSIRMQGADSIETGIKIIIHCSVIRLIKYE